MTSTTAVSALPKTPPIVRLEKVVVAKEDYLFSRPDAILVVDQSLMAREKTITLVAYSVLVAPTGRIEAEKLVVKTQGSSLIGGLFVNEADIAVADGNLILDASLGLRKKCVTRSKERVITKAGILSDLTQLDQEITKLAETKMGLFLLIRADLGRALLYPIYMDVIAQAKAAKAAALAAIKAPVENKGDFKESKGADSTAVVKFDKEEGKRNSSSQDSSIVRIDKDMVCEGDYNFSNSKATLLIEGSLIAMGRRITILAECVLVAPSVGIEAAELVIQARKTSLIVGLHVGQGAISVSEGMVLFELGRGSCSAMGAKGGASYLPSGVFSDITKLEAAGEGAFSHIKDLGEGSLSLYREMVARKKAEKPISFAVVRSTAETAAVKALEQASAPFRAALTGQSNTPVVRFSNTSVLSESFTFSNPEAVFIIETPLVARGRAVSITARNIFISPMARIEAGAVNLEASKSSFIANVFTGGTLQVGVKEGDLFLASCQAGNLSISRGRFYMLPDLFANTIESESGRKKYLPELIKMIEEALPIAAGAGAGAQASASPRLKFVERKNDGAGSKS